MESIGYMFSDEIMKIANPNYVKRPSQIEAAKLISGALHAQDHFILEGTCGFGKTYAYLVPCIDYIIANGREPRLVLVTNGISLQEQLYYNDVPAILKLFKAVRPEADVSVTLLKGRSNYVCTHKVAEIHNTMGVVIGLDPMVRKLVKEYKDEGVIKNADISSFDSVPDFNLHKEIACMDPEECNGEDCGFYGVCGYQMSRRKALISNIVVTNYHMLFTSHMIGGALLGNYDIIVFDEAHDTQNVFRDFLEKKVSIRTFEGIQRKFSEMLKKDSDIGHIVNKESIKHCLVGVEYYFEHVKKSLFMNPEKADSKLMKADIPLCNYPEAEREMENALHYMLGIAGTIVDYYDEQGGEKRHKNYYVAEGLFKRISEIELVTLRYKEVLANDNLAMWVSNDPYNFVKQEHQGVRGVSIHVKPVSVADEMYKGYLQQMSKSCIFTSATISVNGGFEYLKENIGLKLLEDTNKEALETEQKGIGEFIGQSPFDLSEQELWYLPEDAVDGNAKNFKDIIPGQIIEIIKASGGGALCLFTSYISMNNAYKAALDEPLGVRVLRQGDMPKIKLLEAFKKDKDACLFATRSFFQGVDVPGDSLRVLIVDKLPFPSPADPIMIKLQELHGRSTFKKIFIPEMIITLKQAVGRGVRSINDKCVVAVLDGRLATANYKGAVFKSFPYEKRGTRSLSEVSEFLEVDVSMQDLIDEADLPF